MINAVEGVLGHHHKNQVLHPLGDRVPEVSPLQLYLPIIHKLIILTFILGVKEIIQLHLRLLLLTLLSFLIHEMQVIDEADSCAEHIRLL